MGIRFATGAGVVYLAEGCRPENMITADRGMRIFTYIVNTDAGFAPNPFHGVCTLACCKPVIRRTARVGDWVVGLTPARLGPRALVYAMRVGEVLSFAAYWSDARFRRKKPERTSKNIVSRCGDNCYQPLPDGSFRQLHCAHSQQDGREDPQQAEHDLGGRNVLVSRAFTYFGRKALPLPGALAFAVPGRGHKVNFTEAQQAALRAFLERLPVGVLGPPTLWRDGDTSWQQEPLRCG